MKRVASIAIVLVVSVGVAISQTRTNQRVKARNEAKFLYAIETGDVLIFYKLLKRGVKVNASRYDRTTALMVAALNQRLEFLTVLLSKGAHVNAKNKFGNTALMDAAAAGQYEMVRWLLAAGANIRAKNESGFTAVMFAMKAAGANQENYQKVIELLKSYERKQPTQSRRAQHALAADSP